MSTFPLLMSLADELDNLTTRSYLDDFGLGFYPHRHYHRVPSLSLPSEEEWAEQQQYQQRRNSRSRKYSEPIKECYELEQNEVQNIAAEKKIENFNCAIDKQIIDNTFEIFGTKKLNTKNLASNKNAEKHTSNNEKKTHHYNNEVYEKQDYDGYISKHTLKSDNQYDFPKLEFESHKPVQSLMGMKINSQSTLQFNINTKKEKKQKYQLRQSSLEQLDNQEGNSSHESFEEGLHYSKERNK